MTKQEIRDYVKIAKDLNYPVEVIEQIKRAKDENECTKILCTARHKSMR